MKRLALAFLFLATPAAAQYRPDPQGNIYTDLDRVRNVLITAPATAADNVANPVAPYHLSFEMLWDGAAWDRAPGNSATGALVSGTFWQATQPVSGTFWQATQPVSIATMPALVAGSANIGDVDVLTFPDNEPINVAQIAGTAPAAHDAVISGDSVPLTTAAYAETPEDSDANTSGNRASADADKVRLLASRYGVLYTNPCQGPFKWTYHENSSSTLTDTTVHASCGTGFYNYICSVTVSTGAATAFNVFIEDSTTTTILGPWYLEAVVGRGFHLDFSGSGGKRQTTSATLIAVTTSAAIAHSVDIQGYCAP